MSDWAPPGIASFGDHLWEYRQPKIMIDGSAKLLTYILWYNDSKNYRVGPILVLISCSNLFNTAHILGDY